MVDPDERRLGRLALGALVGGFLLLALCFGSGVAALNYNERARQWVIHTFEVKANLAALDLAIERAETAARGHLIAPHRQRVETFHANLALIEPALRELGAMTSDNPVQQQNVAILRQRLEQETASLNRIMQAANSGTLDEARAIFLDQVKAHRMSGVRSSTDAMRQEENRLMQIRIAAERDAAWRAEIVLALTGALLLTLAVTAVWVVRRYTVDLALARTRLRALNSGLETAVAERTKELSRANEEIQRFAYIVSHDLRSPLVNVMGFTAEMESANAALARLVERIDAQAPALMDEEARLAANEDLPEAIGFIRSSTQKMDRLINAILRLSREGRRTLAPEPLVMTDLIGTIRDSLEHRLQATSSTISIEQPLPDLVSDRVAIEQLFSNIIENAVKYLRPGVPGRIVVSGSREGDRLVFHVADNGRGIDPKDHQRVFDLFRRSGRQDEPGEGIGLAHVRALAYRLGGTVDVTSALAIGSTFHLNLPVTYRDQGVAA